MSVVVAWSSSTKKNQLEGFGYGITIFCMLYRCLWSSPGHHLQRKTNLKASATGSPFSVCCIVVCCTSRHFY
ncbi:hypothetical protein BDR05DRAFT_442475 [Suillus weaverae]|nr:hypothetical protein BDR05DRAFT_442475 [Suillus weaverae]